MESKSPLLSKTVWINAILAVSAFFPQVHDVFASHSNLLPLLFGAVNIVLRFVTKGPVKISLF